MSRLALMTWITRSVALGLALTVGWHVGCTGIPETVVAGEQETLNDEDLVVQQSVIDFGEADTSKELEVYNASSETLPFQTDVIYGDGPTGWLTVGPITPQCAPGQGVPFSLAVDRRGLPAGQWSAEVVVTAGAIKKTVIVSLAVVAVATDADSCHFTDQVQDRQIQVWNAGGGTLRYEITAPSWLAVTEPSGTSSGPDDRQTVALHASPDGLKPGRYSADLEIRPVEVLNGSSKSVQVVLDVPDVPASGQEGSLEVTSANELTASGPVGGPFAPGSITYTMSNPGDTTIDWTAGTAAPSWVTLSKTNGTLAGKANDTVTISIAPSAANLQAGTYGGKVTFVNTTNHVGDTARKVGLTVNAPQAEPGALIVTPANGLTASGPVGGPFTPDNITYTVSNLGDTTIDWTAGTAAPSWVTLSKTSGTLAGNATDTVTVSLAPSAADLRAGTYGGSVTFVNETDHSGDTTRSVALTVEPALSNLAPVVDAGPDQTIAWPANSVPLNPTVSDDGLPTPPGALTFAWAKLSGPGTVTFANPASATTAATFGAPGTYQLQLAVSDGSLGTSDTIIITAAEQTWNSWEHLHDFTGLPMTEDGWTDLLAMYQHPDYYEDSRIIYVSSSEGDDATGTWYAPTASVVGADPYNPAGPIQPFKTLAAAYSHLRDGYPDLMLLKRGDVWEESFSSGSAGDWAKSGSSPVERIILATYGEGDRPLLNLGPWCGINCSGIDNFIVAGIRFFSHTWQTVDAEKGVDILSGGTGAHHQLHEDCLYERHDLNRIQGSADNPHAHIAFRRCVTIDIGEEGANSGTFYVTQTEGFLFEENVVYAPNTESRWLYLSPSGNDDSSSLRAVLVRGNIFFTSTRTGISGRSGGLFANNLIVRNNGFHIGGAGGSAGSVQNADVTNNVFLESSGGTTIALTLSGLDGSLDNGASGLIKGNIFTDGAGITGSSTAIGIVAGSGDAAIAKNLTIDNNIVYNWTGEGTNRAMTTDSGFLANGVSGVLIRNNDFQFTSVNPIKEIILHRAYADGNMRFEGFSYYGNRYFVDTPSSPDSWFTPGGSFVGWVSESGETGAQLGTLNYPDPDRTLKTYSASLGGAPSTEAFMAEALLQSRAYWRPEYTAAAANAYIREGFAMPAGGID